MIGSDIAISTGGGVPTVGLLVLAIMAVVYAVGAVRDYLDDEPEPYTPAHVRWQYEQGEISLAELERRQDVLLDDEKMRIFEATQRVGGVGEKTAWELAAHFDTEDEYRAADIDELQEVYGVGPELAERLAE